MKAFIIQFPFGVAAFDEQKSLVEKVLITRKPQVAARSLLKTESGQLSDEVFSLITLLKSAGYDSFVFEHANLADEAMRKMDLKTEVAKPAEADVLRSKMSTVAFESGFAGDEQELGLWNRNVSLELAKFRIKGASEKRDLIVAQGIQTLDDLDRTVNLFMGRLREWYGVYFPELDRLIEKHETYARLVITIGYREDYIQENLEKENIPKERAAIVAKTAESSMGADISVAGLQQIQLLAKSVLEFYELRKSTEHFVDRTMEEMAPNVRAVAGALLGARLIALAGSLRNLAIRPASTIQVLGAEKALFRSLKTGARPPKHGLIFQHTLLHDAKRWQRGKIARVIAGKLAIAARADSFGGKYIGDMLKEEINKRINEIHEKYKEPPPPKEAKPRPERAEVGFRERREGAGERPFRPREGGERPFRPREGGERTFRLRESGERPSRPREGGGNSERSFRPREGGDRPFRPRKSGERPFGKPESGDRAFKPRDGGEGGHFQERPRRDQPGGGRRRPKQWRDRRAGQG
jgi:nucleolar protein 56